MKSYGKQAPFCTLLAIGVALIASQATAECWNDYDIELDVSAGTVRSDGTLPVLATVTWYGAGVDSLEEANFSIPAGAQIRPEHAQALGFAGGSFTNAGNGVYRFDLVPVGGAWSNGAYRVAIKVDGRPLHDVNASDMALLAFDVAGVEPEQDPQHIEGYWGDPEWQNKELAEDGDWDTAAAANHSNRALYAEHPYNGTGPRYWRFKYSSSGSEWIAFSCHNYETDDWENVYVGPSHASGKTVTTAIPSACLRSGQPIRMRVWSCDPPCTYYEGEIVSNP